MTNPQPQHQVQAPFNQQQAPFNQPQAPSAGQVRSQLSGMKNNQLFVGAMAFVAVMLWLFRNLNWIIVTDKSSIKAVKAVGIDGGGQISFFEAADMPINLELQLGVAGIYTGALLFLMLVSAAIAVFAIHFKSALRLAVISLVGYLALTVFQFFIPLSAVLGSEDVKEDIGIRPGIGIIFTWIFLALIIAASVFFSTQSKKMAQANQAQPHQFAPAYGAPGAAPFQANAPQQQPQQAWGQQPQPQQHQPQQPQPQQQASGQQTQPQQPQAQQPWEQQPQSQQPTGQENPVPQNPAPAAEAADSPHKDEAANPWESADEESDGDNRPNPWA